MPDSPTLVERVLTLGPFQTNTYLLGAAAEDDAARPGIVVDPSFEAEPILAAIEEEGLSIGHIVLTHGHVDHVSAVAPVHEATGAEILIHEKDVPFYERAPITAAQFGLSLGEQPTPTGFLAGGDTLRFGPFELSVIHTPGHTPGGICLHFAEQALLVSGDTLFARSIGRTDLPGGSMRDLVHSIRDKLYRLDGAIRVLPGHGPPTTLREEMFGNPFVSL